MKFSVITRTVNGVVVLDLSGRMATREPLDQLHSAVQGALDSGSRQLAFNMRDVEVMDSSGLATLRDCIVLVKEKQAQLRLFSVSERILTLLRITQFNRIIEILEDEKAALASFKTT